MISQNCPRCNSTRIRRGYRPTPFWSKIIFRYNLLCNACNWEFKGFAVPGTVTVKPVRKHKKQAKTDEVQDTNAGTEPEAYTEQANAASIVESGSKEITASQAEEEETEVAEKAVSSNLIRVKKKVRIRQL